MFDLYYILGAIAYTIVGQLMIKVTYNYLKELEAKTATIDPRFCDKLWITIDVKSEKTKIILEWLWKFFWPVTCIAAILKAEWEYSSIRHHVFARRSP